MDLQRYIIGVKKQETNSKESIMSIVSKLFTVCALVATTAFAANGIHLPVYQYAGYDAVKAALTEYVMSEFTPLEDDPDVTIPVVNVIAMDYSKDGETLVWGSFSVYNYELRGDTLVSISGGEYPGFARLKRTGDGYEVDSFEVIGEKTKNTAAVKKALGKHYNTFKKIEGDVALREKIRAKTIADYVHSHDLAITKYQATGKKARTI